MYRPYVSASRARTHFVDVHPDGWRWRSVRGLAGGGRSAPGGVGALADALEEAGAHPRAHLLGLVTRRWRGVAEELLDRRCDRRGLGGRCRRVRQLDTRTARCVLA